MSRQAIVGPRAKSEAPVGGGILQRKCACGQHTGGGECEGCRKKRQGTLQRAGKGPATAMQAPAVVHEVLRSPGQAMTPTTRDTMESRFDHDFSRVRVHSDARAAESARAVNALAYTVGSDVVFGGGQYQPSTLAGQRLLAHELAHVVQQRGAALQPRLEVGPGDTPEERQAEAAAEAVVAGQALPALSTGPSGLQRAESEEMEPTEEEEVAEAEPARDDSEANVHDGEAPAGGGTVEVGELSDAQQGVEEDSPPAALDTLAEESAPAASELAKKPAGKAPAPSGKKGKQDKAPAEKRWIKHVEVSLDGKQSLELTWSDGAKASAPVSTGRGCPNTGIDPCPLDTTNPYCTPTGDFHPGKKGGAKYQNSKGSLMWWYVEFSEVATRGIGIHDSQTVTGAPLSHGCIRVDEATAKAINQNTSSQTTIHVGGKAKTSAWSLAKEKMGAYKDPKCPDPPEKPKPKAKKPAGKKAGNSKKK
jgi:hypothetical protein